MNELPNTPPDKSVTIRCPRLGHQIHFDYCRKENMGAPCFKTLDCWYLRFDVVGHLKSEMAEEEFNAAFEKPAKPKVASLLDLIRQAQTRTGGTGETDGTGEPS